MTILSKSRIVVIPDGFEAGQLNMVKPFVEVGQPVKFFPFTRSSVAYRRNSIGYWESRADNIPRIHFPVGGGCPRILLEDQNTNICFHSNDVNNAYWNKTNVTPVPASGVSPSGSNDAVLIYPVSSGGNRTIDKTFTITAGVSYVTYCIVKASGINWIRHGGINAGGAEDYVWVNLATGAIGVHGVNLTGYGAIDMDNGYWLVWAAQVSTSTTGNLYSAIVDGDGVGTVTANGTDGMLWWLNQIHEGTYPCSPIITAGGSATRASDLCGTSAETLTLGDFTARMLIKPLKLNNTMLIGSNTSGAGNSYIYLSASNIYFKSSAGAETVLGAHGMNLNTEYKIIIKRTGTQVKFFRDNVLILTTVIDDEDFILNSIFTSKDGGGTSVPSYGLFGMTYICDSALSDTICLDPNS
ncbi:MAG: hypothetical protein WC760_06370 [Bacteroidia bacterium]|jgi:hypothetical protein